MRYLTDFGVEAPNLDKPWTPRSVCGTYASRQPSFQNRMRCHFTFERPVKWKNPIDNGQIRIL